MSNPAKCPHCGTPLPAGALAGLCPACLLRQGAAAPSQGKGAAGFEPPPISEVARLFPQLDVLELVGKGGMGAIYKARQRELDRIVALKILPPQPGGGQDFAARFNREARALARLSHPNIVAVHEFGQVDGLHYFMMEFVDGVNLRQLERAGRRSPREALQIIPQICDALQYAHDQGVVHRDIKPENVLIDRQGRVKIADFGLAKILGCDPDAARLTCAGQVMGTPHYMAPEQVERPLEVDHRADIYALGVVFYEMLTGELPLGKFAAPSRKVELDVRLDEVVLRALEKEPERRYQQAGEVRTAVENASVPRTESGADAEASGSPLRGGVWRSIRYRIWPPLVGRRNGERVINWPAVAMRGMRGVFAMLFAAAMLLLVIGMVGGGRLSLLVAIVPVVFGLVFVPFILTMRVLRGLAAPLDLLPDLDRPGVASAGPPSRMAAILTGVGLFLTVLLTGAFITGVMPRMWAAQAVIQVEPLGAEAWPEPGDYDPFFVQTQIETIKSSRVLDRVVQRLSPPERWARLSDGLEIRQLKNSSTLQITYTTQSPGGAEEVVSDVVDVYRELGTAKVRVISIAIPPSSPVRPNVPLNLLASAGLGLILGTIGARLVHWARAGWGRARHAVS